MAKLESLIERLAGAVAPKSKLLKAHLGEARCVHQKANVIMNECMSAYKPFSQEAHDACDPAAREAVIKFLARCNRTAYPHPNKYKVDLIVENEFMVPVCYAEIEMRDWGSCPFPTVHVPSRKKKLVNNDLPTLYFVVSKGLEKAMWCEGKDIVASPLREVPNKEVKEGEYFYDVPINCFTEVLL